MVDLKTLDPKTLQAMDPAAMAGLATRMLAELAAQTRQLQQQQELAQRHEREIKFKDAKLEKVTFELARLKAWKFGARTERMNAEQRQMFEDTAAEDEADLQAQLQALQGGEAASPAGAEKTPRQPRRQKLPEHLPALLRVHRLDLGAEFPGFKASELEGDALDLRVLELDLALVPRNVLGLLGQPGEHRSGQLCHGAFAQTLEVLRLERVHIEHGPIVGMRVARRHRASSDCPARQAFPGRTRSLRSHAGDDPHVLQALPRQAHHERVELRLRERGQRACGCAWPREAALVQAPGGAPHTEAVVHHHLHARTARVGKEVTVVSPRRAEDLHHACQQPVGAGAHVDRLHRQPHRLDADHRSNSRIHAAHSTTASAGHVTEIVVAPRRSSALAPQPGTSKRAPGHKIYLYLLRKIAVTRPNQVWALDTTYIAMGRKAWLFAGSELAGQRAATVIEPGAVRALERP